MAKSHDNDNHDSDILARLDALEQENRELRAVMAKERGDARDAAIDRLISRVEDTAPALAQKKMNERIAAAMDAKARDILEAYRELLDGDRTYVLGTLTVGTVRGGQVLMANLIGGTGRLTCANSEAEAKEKYMNFMGINRNDPGPHGTFFDGASVESLPLADDEMEELRAKCMAIIDRGGSDHEIVRLMHAAAEKASVAYLAQRNYNPETAGAV